MNFSVIGNGLYAFRCSHQICRTKKIPVCVLGREPFDDNPSVGINPLLVIVRKHFSKRAVVFEIQFLDLSSRLPEHRGDTGLLVVQSRSQLGMHLVFNGNLHIDSKCCKDSFGRYFAAVFIPFAQFYDRLG